VKSIQGNFLSRNKGSKKKLNKCSSATGGRRTGTYLSSLAVGFNRKLIVQK
jgi:hypothetical protein